jgi:hypothetical protein
MRRIAGILLIVGCVGWGFAQPAAPSVRPDDNTPVTAPPAIDLPATIDQLSADTYAQRQAAERALLRQSPAILPQVEEALVASRDVEKTVRLRKIAAHLLLKIRNSRAGMPLLGVSLGESQTLVGTARAGARVVTGQDATGRGDQEMVPALMVMEIQPGFPAAESIEPGDLVTAVDGQGLTEERTFEHFREQIGTHNVSDLVSLRVQRGATSMTVKVPLVGVDVGDSAELAEMLRQRAGLAADFLAAIEARRPVERPVVVADNPSSSAAPRLPALRGTAIITVPGQTQKLEFNTIPSQPSAPSDR